MDGHWRFIMKLIEIADNLEVLTQVDVNRIKGWIEPKQVPTCLLLHLKTKRIEQKMCTENGFDMVRYLMWNAKVGNIFLTR
ncbi:hypothetical protein PHJA_001794300 [Phtheirospermum japonicum]|uniref:FBD domain-containing protein n=1 Tax=Phtheirospermum japonicum TaxID=374723 RepID=A0A830CDT0_9LAMI|nr:hypothetical protein PHJA_001794300 [Phtheirospermum japonicum]